MNNNLYKIIIIYIFHKRIFFIFIIYKMKKGDSLIKKIEIINTKFYFSLNCSSETCS